MPLRLEKSDRRLLMWALLVLLPIIVAVALATPDEEESSLPSTYSAQTRGAKAAYLLLKEEGYDVERWERTPGELPLTAVGTALILASPVAPPTPEERHALESYLNRGGRVLITGPNIELYLSQARIDREPLPARVPNDYRPQLASSITRGGSIKMSPLGYWAKASTGFLAHYADDGRPVVVSYKVGQGNVVWWAASTPLTNGAINQSGDLALLLNSLGASPETRILWDEYFHGYRHTLGDYLWAAPIRYSLLQGALIFLAMLATYSRRNGPIHPRREASRLSPLEFVHTLGNLYRRANATRSAIEVPYNRFRFLATRQLGLKSDTPADELARAIRNRFGYKDSSLEGLFRQIESAMYDADMKEAKVLELVQQLSYHTYRLKLIPLERQETTTNADRVAGAQPRAN